MKKTGRPNKYIWIAYQKEAPGLPIATADSAEKLARMIGVSVSTVTASAMRGNRFKHNTYARVEVEDGSND